jgi:hypothetical protein
VFSVLFAATAGAAGRPHVFRCLQVLGGGGGSDLISEVSFVPFRNLVLRFVHK